MAHRGTLQANQAEFPAQILLWRKCQRHQDTSLGDTHIQSAYDTPLQRRLTRPWNLSGLATMVRIVLMYYINMDTFFERPDKNLKLLLKQTAEKPPEEEDLI